MELADALDLRDRGAELLLERVEDVGLLARADLGERSGPGGRQARQARHPQQRDQSRPLLRGDLVGPRIGLALALDRRRQLADLARELGQQRELGPQLLGPRCGGGAIEALERRAGSLVGSERRRHQLVARQARCDQREAAQPLIDLRPLRGQLAVADRRRRWGRDLRVGQLLRERPGRQRVHGIAAAARGSLADGLREPRRELLGHDEVAADLRQPMGLGRRAQQPLCHRLAARVTRSHRSHGVPRRRRRQPLDLVDPAILDLGPRIGVQGAAGRLDGRRRLGERAGHVPVERMSGHQLLGSHRLRHPTGRDRRLPPAFRDRDVLRRHPRQGRGQACLELGADRDRHGRQPHPWAGRAVVVRIAVVGQDDASGGHRRRPGLWLNGPARAIDQGRKISRRHAFRQAEHDVATVADGQEVTELGQEFDRRFGDEAQVRVAGLDRPGPQEGPDLVQRRLIERLQVHWRVHRRPAVHRSSVVRSIALERVGIARPLARDRGRARARRRHRQREVGRRRESSRPRVGQPLDSGRRRVG